MCDLLERGILRNWHSGELDLVNLSDRVRVCIRLPASDHVCVYVYVCVCVRAHF
jgi:hypothetical protein